MDSQGSALPPPCAEECRRTLIDIMGRLGGDVHATWVQPLFPTGYEPLGMSCPHGVPWFMEPTAEQRLRWEEESDA